MVVNLGSTILLNSVLSKPITEISSGTFKPSLLQAFMAPTAIRSLQAKIAVIFLFLVKKLVTDTIVLSTVSLPFPLPILITLDG